MFLSRLHAKLKKLNGHSHYKIFLFAATIHSKFQQTFIYKATFWCLRSNVWLELLSMCLLCACEQERNLPACAIAQTRTKLGCSHYALSTNILCKPVFLLYLTSRMAGLWSTAGVTDGAMKIGTASLPEKSNKKCLQGVIIANSAK